MLSPLLVTGHEFFSLNSFLLVLMILLCLLLGGLIKRFRLHRILPESAAIMLFGLACGALLNLTSKQEKEIFRFSPNVIFFIVLPPIILDAGYTLKRRDFFQNLGTILLLAVTGTVLNCIVFGYILFGFAKVGWVPLDRTSPLESLLFGSIISATDPVATLAMLGSKEVNAHPLLYSLVFGESVLNDAIAIVLYKTFEGAMPDSEFTQGGSDETSFGATDLFKALGTFLGVSIGSVVMGVGIALVCCFIFKRIDFSKFPIYEFTLVSLFAYLSYFAAEMVELSGIMSLFFCSVCLAHYNYYNLSTNAQIATLECYKSLAQICETFVFCYLGITAGLSIQSTYLKWSIGMIVITILTCLVARAGNVFPICALANLGRKIKVPFKMQIPLWWAGLRGAVCFALCLSFPGENGKYVVSSTLMLVLFTTIVCGGLTLPVLRCSGMSNPPGAEHGEGEGAEGGFELLDQSERRDDAGGDLDELREEDESKSNGAALADGSQLPSDSDSLPSLPPPRRYRGLVGLLKRWDDVYMRRWFGGQGYARGQASGIIDEYGAPVMLAPGQAGYVEQAGALEQALRDPELVRPNYFSSVPYLNPQGRRHSASSHPVGTAPPRIHAMGSVPLHASSGGEQWLQREEQVHWGMTAPASASPLGMASAARDHNELASIFAAPASAASGATVGAGALPHSSERGSYRPPLYSPQPPDAANGIAIVESTSPASDSSGTREDLTEL